ncbi:MAG: hypothetical protein O3A92_15170 [Verrucomicrobia bacterium]|nr:hypothetical protein [Verrucomicrobiota bacterium]
MNAVDPGTGLDPAKRYRVVFYRIPKETLGGVVEVHEYGTPVDEGDYWVRSYYVTPDVSVARTLFWRMEVTP